MTSTTTSRSRRVAFQNNCFLSDVTGGTPTLNCPLNSFVSKRSNGKNQKKFVLEGLGRDRSGYLPKRPQSPPFEPEVRLSSGYTSNPCPTIVLSTLYPQNGLGKVTLFSVVQNCTTVLPP
jgi:hypothetical protein